MGIVLVLERRVSGAEVLKSGISDLDPQLEGIESYGLLVKHSCVCGFEGFLELGRAEGSDLRGGSVH